jgi:hypothetical protein
MALAPSPPGQDFAAADVQRAQIGPEEAGRIILQYQQAGKSADPTALLAALVKDAAKANSRQIVVPYRLVGGAQGQIQQLLPENPLRVHLSLWHLSGVASFYLLEPGPLQATDLPQTDIDAMQTRALNNSVGFILAATFEFYRVPINAVTVFTNSAATIEGFVIEGV